MDRYPIGALVIARNRVYDVHMLGIILDNDNARHYTIRSTKLRTIRNPDGTTRGRGYTKYVIKAVDITPIPADQLHLPYGFLRDIYNANDD